MNWNKSKLAKVRAARANVARAWEQIGPLIFTESNVPATPLSPELNSIKEGLRSVAVALDTLIDDGEKALAE